MGSSAAVRAGRAFVELFSVDQALVSGLASAATKLRSFGATVSGIGREMIMLSVSAAAPFAVGAKNFADFETQVANVSTMLQKPGQYLGEFRDGLQRMSVQFGESTETLSKGLYDILSASVAPEKAMKVLEVSAMAARAGLSNTATAVDAITTILNSYGMEATRAGEVSDWMFQTVLRGKITFEQLASGIGNVANIASVAGVSLDELGAMIALMTRNGIQSDEAITSLRGIIAGFIKPADDAAKAAKEIGFSMDTATLKALGLNGVFQMLNGLPPEVIGRLFPEVRALKGVLSAMSSLQGFGEDLASMAGKAGSTETAYKKMADTMTTETNRAWQAIIQLSVSVGEALSPTIKEAAVHVRDAAEAAAHWVSNNQQFVKMAAAAVVVVGALGAGLVALGAAIVPLAAGLTVVSITLGLLASLASAAGAFLASMLSPMSFVVRGVLFLGVQFLSQFSQIGDAWGSLGNTMQRVWEILQPVITTGMNLLKSVWGGNTQDMQSAWWAFKDKVFGAWNLIKPMLLEQWTNLKNKWAEFVDEIKAKWNSVWDRIYEVVDGHITNIGTLLDAFSGESVKTNSKMLKEWSREWQDMWDGMYKNVIWATDFTETFINGVGKDFKVLGEIMEEAVFGPIRGAKLLIEDLGNAWRSFFDFENAIGEMKIGNMGPMNALTQPLNTDAASMSKRREALVSQLKTMQPLVGGAASQYPAYNAKVVENTERIVRELNEIKQQRGGDPVDSKDVLRALQDSNSLLKKIERFMPTLVPTFG